MPYIKWLTLRLDLSDKAYGLLHRAFTGETVALEFDLYDVRLMCSLSTESLHWKVSSNPPVDRPSSATAMGALPSILLAT